MKGLDIFIVRFTPFILFLILGVNMWCCYDGVDITITYNLHGNSALYALAMFFISLSNKKYHCEWNTAMYVYLIFVPILNFIDAAFNLIPEIDTYLFVLFSTYTLVAVYAAFMAIRHFVLMSKRRLDNGGR